MADFVIQWLLRALSCVSPGSASTVRHEKRRLQNVPKPPLVSSHAIFTYRLCTMPLSKLIPVLAALVLVGSGCSMFEFEGSVTAEADPPALIIQNETNRTIYYIAGEASDFARVDVDLSAYADWPRLAAGHAATIPYDRLMFYDAGDTDAWIYWTTDDGDSDSIDVSLE